MTHALVADSSPADRARPQAPRGYRPELHGLRAVAVILVVVYHVWLDRVSGGVDVFFVLTGFLIVGQLYRACLRGPLSLRTFWRRLANRLFPAALTVLLCVIVASFLVLPEHRWFQTIREVFAAALYWENWQLVLDSADYLAQNNSASVVQHFWSLSIQGQFYLVMPCVVLLTAVVARTAGWGLRASLLAVLTVGFVASFGYSVWLTAHDQALAYFHTATRIWEFLLGGLLALVINQLRLGRRLRIVAGWVGVLALIACGLVLQAGSLFPGYAALWPTVAAALVLVAGSTGSAAGVDRWLAARPAAFIGDISYALFLWHWPVLLFYLVATRQETPGLLGGALVIAVSFALAALTFHLIEEPARRSLGTPRTRTRAVRVGVVLLIALFMMSGSWFWYGVERAKAYAVSGGDPYRPGAAARMNPARDAAAFPVEPGPSLLTLHDDYAELGDARCATSRHHSALEVCRTPDGERAGQRIVVVGDSHVHQKLSALEPIAQHKGWEIITLIEFGCPFSVRGPGVWMNDECAELNSARVAEIADLRPDVVLTMGSYRVFPGRTEQTPDGFVEQWRSLDELDIDVVAFRDNPRFDQTFQPAQCAAEHGVDAQQCAPARAEIYPEVPPYERITDLPPNVRFIDLTDYYCTDTRCPPVIGNVWVYMDHQHLSASYVRTLTPVVERELTGALGD